MSPREHVLPDVDGIVTAAELLETVDAIASIQLADGNIPWFPGGHTDPWNMVEAAMALDLGGLHDESRAAYDWLAGMQRADGGWHAYYLGDDIEDPTLDTNVTCYVATGAWHHHLVTGDTAYLRQLWPTVEAAIDFALDFQRETGEIAWRGDDPDDGALLTGSSSIHHSLKCALAIAERLGHERPDWELSLGALAIAIAHRPDVFLDKDRWAMDWYYPILGGVLRGYPANARDRRPLGALRGRGPRRALRVRPSVGHRGGDVRAGHGARRHRVARARAPACTGRCSSCAPRAAATGPAPTSTTTRSTSTASSTPSSSPRGTRPRSCSRRTRSPAPAPPRACSAASVSPKASTPTSCSPPASRSKKSAPVDSRRS